MSAPPNLRDELRELRQADLVARVARFHVQLLSGPREATRLTLRLLARRYQSLTTEIDVLDEELRRLIEEHAPHMLAIRGAQTEVAGTLLVVAGDKSPTSPVRGVTRHAVRRLAAAGVIGDDPSASALTGAVLARATAPCGG